MKLGPGEVHLWLLDLEQFASTEALARCRQLLDRTELDRVSRLQLPLHRNRQILSRGVLRHLCSRYVDNSFPQELQFSVNAFGRPEIHGPQPDPPLFFNISHSGTSLALLFSRGSLTGVDVEMIRQRRLLLQIARRHFAPSELAQLIQLAGTSRLERFYDLWTLKEAYIKARGMGLAIPLDSFSFSFAGQDQSLLEFSRDPADTESAWRFLLYHMPTARMSLALGGIQPGDALQLRLRTLISLDSWHSLELAPAAVSGKEF